MQDAQLINNIIIKNDINENSLMDITIDSYSETSSESSTERTSIFNPLCNIFTYNTPVKGILKKDLEQTEQEKINKKIHRKIYRFCCGILVVISCLVAFTICIIII